MSAGGEARDQPDLASSAARATTLDTDRNGARSNVLAVGRARLRRRERPSGSRLVRLRCAQAVSPPPNARLTRGPRARTDNLQVQWGSQEHYEIVRKVGRGKYSEASVGVVH